MIRIRFCLLLALLALSYPLYLGKCLFTWRRPVGIGTYFRNHLTIG